MSVIENARLVMVNDIAYAVSNCTVFGGAYTLYMHFHGKYLTLYLSEALDTVYGFQVPSTCRMSPSKRSPTSRKYQSPLWMLR